MVRESDLEVLNCCKIPVEANDRAERDFSQI
jgi:hypothetical protein